MKVNWAERIWVNSPARRYVQRREARFFKEMRDLPSGCRCLEIGCGSGAGARIISRIFSPAGIHALDIDPEMVDLARRKKAAWGLDELQLTAGDAQDLPYKDESFDAVFNYGIIHHVEDWRRSIREVRRVLVPGGGFYFEEIYPPLYAGPLLRHIVDHPRENRFHGPDFRATLEGSGLKILPGCKESRFAILGVAVRG